ncbi:hypothetical protein BGZ76_011394 [Entomortierella beljakovae]|nr:hypothetical protein BGZ76_011394 [Entomortierella beljakovae]
MNEDNRNSNTKRIIQHFDSLSRKTRPPFSHNPLGVRQHVGVGHKVEKKPLSSNATSFRSSINTTTRISGTIQNSSNGKRLIQPIKEKLNAERRFGVAALRSETFTTGVAESPLDFRSNNARQDQQHSAASSRKRKEELYLSQTRLMQWYIVDKRASLHFKNQEKSAEEQFDMVGRLLLERQEVLHSSQERFEVEKELIELESTLGYQRESLLAVIDGLESFKSSYSDLLDALDQEANVLDITAFGDNNLQQWLDQVQDCMSVLKANSSREEGLVCVSQTVPVSAFKPKHASNQNVP